MTELTQYQKLRDIVASLSLTLAFAGMVYVPVEWMLGFANAFNNASLEAPLTNIHDYRSIYWTSLQSRPDNWYVVIGFFLALSYFVVRARSFFKGIVLPLLVFSTYLFVSMLVSMQAMFFMRSWLACTPMIVVISIPYLLILKKCFASDLTIRRTFTDAVFILSSIIVPQIVGALEISFFADSLRAFYGIVVNH